MVSSAADANRATVAAGFVGGMLAGVRTRGGDTGELLRAAGVEEGQRVPIAAYAALYNHVVAAMQDEGFGLFRAPVPQGTFEFLCRGVLSARTLAEALDRAARFLRIAIPDLQVVVTRGQQAGWLAIREAQTLTLDPNDPRRIFAFEWLLRLIHGLCCWLVGRGLALDHVRFPYARPDHAADYALIYSEHVTFDATDLQATFDVALLDLPVRRDEADLQAFLEGAPGKISMLYRRDRETARTLRELLAQDLAQAPSFEQAARRLHLSPRTLHRRLREEGASFRGIKDSLRKEAALAHLGRSQKGVAETALHVGFSEPSAFFRAFQAWTGETPSAYRRRQRPG